MEPTAPGASTSPSPRGWPHREGAPRHGGGEEGCQPATLTLRGSCNFGTHGSALTSGNHGRPGTPGAQKHVHRHPGQCAHGCRSDFRPRPWPRRRRETEAPCRSRGPVPGHSSLWGNVAGHMGAAHGLRAPSTGPWGHYCEPTSLSTATLVTGLWQVPGSAHCPEPAMRRASRAEGRTMLQHTHLLLDLLEAPHGPRIQVTSGGPAEV